MRSSMNSVGLTRPLRRRRAFTLTNSPATSERNPRYGCNSAGSGRYLARGVSLGLDGGSSQGNP